ncbi:uncharacterized protein B0P05DRAFT_569325 [Gilbertella persicaria]|uniref:uncharacterized protein n=1 Tax=Gilbertella persicaria TaxID=101096 RepID=UPI00221EF51B|nr:uncharacterized protein B0P05DRAFT_569325 [Gilbertella persicaria]KAI8087843.1 hypothetical protein B0P05DRAFT_569325 [Gilbertella persicaria]
MSFVRPFFRIPTVCRSLHTSVVHHENFAESLTDKFIDQAKKQRRQNKTYSEPTRFVQVDHMPPTATFEDINKLAREAFPKGDKTIDESKHAYIDLQLIDKLLVIFCRNQEFNFNGRVVVAMASSEDARRLVEYGNRRALGGHIVKMSHIGHADSTSNSIMNKHRRSELTHLADASHAAGRSVIMTGLPFKTQPEHVLGFLRARNFFPSQGTPDHVLRLRTKEQSTVSKFLIKFDSESEAWRCVRAFHNTDFMFKQRNQNYRLKLQVAY